MTINIKGQDVELRYCSNTQVIYETIMQEPLDYSKLVLLGVQQMLLFSNIKASIQANKLDLPLTYEEFQEWYDQDNIKYGTRIMGEYMLWYQEHLSEQFEIIANIEPKEEEQPKKKKTRKKN